MLIVLFGPDGSGKSTLVRALAEELRRRGLRVATRWMRGSHTMVSLLSRVLSSFDSFKGSLNPYYKIAIPRGMVRLWQFLEWVSAIPVILTRYIIPSKFGLITIGDRFSPDLVVWIALTTNDKSFLNGFFSRHLLSLAWKSDHLFFVRAEPKILAERSREGPSFLVKQLALYEAIARALKASIIDTTGKSVEESLAEILDRLSFK